MPTEKLITADPVEMTDAEHAALYKQQYREITSQDHRPYGHCVCGKHLIFDRMYRCLYCGLFYCWKCAEKHFGQTVEEYEQERQVENNA